MISVVACTNREGYVGNIIRNFQKQSLQEKELILILNSSKLNFQRIQQVLRENSITSQLLHFPAKISLGECLNRGGAGAKYDYIAKMDDDDYYGEDYLTEAYQALLQTKADVVGKSSFYIFFMGKKELRLYNPSHENSWIINNGHNHYKTSYFLSGATLVFKKGLLKSIAFPLVNQGEDSGFQRLCFTNKRTMYSLGKDHYVYVRYETPHTHTSDVTDMMLRSKSRFVLRTPSIEGVIENLDKKRGQ
ncbi:MAG: glycosyltransferase [Bacillus sp. (in: Bacteria)]|nr:glycosyltransferase [Bacillus sp. (in: firmicutes)]